MIKYSRLPTGSGLKLIDEHTVRKTFQTVREETLIFLQSLCSHLIARPDPMVVPIFNFNYLGYRKGHYNYSYDMMRCGKISVEERLIIDDVADAHSLRQTNPTNNFCWDAKNDPIYVREQYPKLMSFLDNVIELNRYHDLHGHNIMLNQDRELCLIDLEGFTNIPLNKPENDWILI